MALRHSTSTSLKTIKRYMTMNSIQPILQLVILGPPGSGKGTISERVVKEFKLRHLSAGDLLRMHIMSKSSFGKKIEPIVAAGQLVPIELLAPLINHEISQTKSGWLLDGYPRSKEQAINLELTFPPQIVIYLNVPFSTIIDRIKSRWIHMPSGRVYNLEFSPPKVPGKDNLTGEDLVQREDDKPESVMKRLEIYQSMVDPLLNFYKEKKVLREFAGTESNVIWPDVKHFLYDFNFSLSKRR